MFPIHPTWRVIALTVAIGTICILTLGLGIGLGDPANPAFRYAVLAGLAGTVIAVAAALVGWRLAAQPRAHARAPAPEGSPTVRALAADPRLMEAYNRMELAVGAVEATTRARMGMAEVTAEVAAQTMRPYAGLESQLAINQQDTVYGAATLPSDEELRRELAAYRTTTPVRADAVLRTQRQQRAAYWHERATALLEEGNVQAAMRDVLRSCADQLDPSLVKGIAERLVQDVDAFVPPALLPGAGREAQIMELSVLSDTRLYAGQATRQLARMVEELCDRNAELAGRVVSGIGHAAAAQARANEEAIDPDAKPEVDLGPVSDHDLMEEAITRGLVRLDGSMPPPLETRA